MSFLDLKKGQFHMSFKWQISIIVSILMLTLFNQSKCYAAGDEKSKNLEAFGKQLAKKNGLKFLIDGVGTVVDSTDVYWDMSFTSDRAMTIDDARPLVVSMIQDFWVKVNKDPIYKTELDKRHAFYTYVDPNITPQRLGFKLAFWDKNVDRPLPPYLAQIKVLKGVIQYYQANPKDQSFQPPIIETFQEAFSKANQPALNKY
jgi:hypothetical protein